MTQTTVPNLERHLHNDLPWDSFRTDSAGSHRGQGPDAAAETADSSKPSGRARTDRRPLGSGAKSPDDRRVWKKKRSVEH